MVNSGLELIPDTQSWVFYLPRVGSNSRDTGLE